MKKRELEKLRGSGAAELHQRLQELNLEKAKLMGKLERSSGTLGEDAGKIKNLRRETATIKTILNEKK